MKKFYLVALAAVTMLLVGCTDVQTPETDTTKLYPAMNSTGDLWGYVDGKGNFVIPAMFESASGFSCGYAQVVIGDEVKFIDKKGKIQSTMSFDYATDFYYGYSTILLDENVGLLSKDLTMAISPYYFNLGLMGDNGLIAAKFDEDAKFSYLNSKGETKIPAMFDAADQFKDGLAIIQMNEKYGAINKTGEFIIQPTHKYPLNNMGEGLVSYVDKNDKMGILNSKGEIVVSAIYEQIGSISDGMIPYVGKSKCGYMDKTGNVIIPELYYEVWPFYEGYAWVKQSSSSNYTCVDKEAKIVFMLSKEDTPVTGFHNGLALVQTKNGYKYVDTTGALVYSWSNSRDDMTPKHNIEDNEIAPSFIKQEMMTNHFDSRKL